MTRREGYPESVPVPPLVIPEECRHIWDWFAEVSSLVGRVRDGACDPIPPSEWLAWKTLTGNMIHPWEQETLFAMDIAFCEEINKELENKRAAYQDEMKNRGKRGK